MVHSVPWPASVSKYDKLYQVYHSITSRTPKGGRGGVVLGRNYKHRERDESRFGNHFIFSGWADRELTLDQNPSYT